VHLDGMHTAQEKRSPFRNVSCGVFAWILLTGCTQSRVNEVPALPGTFASVLPVLEQNCVHCHGENRLGHMPAFDSNHALANLRGSANWIVPGKPEKSRFFQVVTFSDETPMAMPPSGHAISPSDLDRIRQWIKAGAPIPEGKKIRIKPRGSLPRSV
jgi:hypothetical protein